MLRRRSGQVAGSSFVTCPAASRHTSWVKKINPRTRRKRQLNFCFVGCLFLGELRLRAAAARAQHGGTDQRENHHSMFFCVHGLDQKQESRHRPRSTRCGASCLASLCSCSVGSSSTLLLSPQYPRKNATLRTTCANRSTARFLYRAEEIELCKTPRPSSMRYSDDGAEFKYALASMTGAALLTLVTR